jgi:hypothetical protein
MDHDIHVFGKVALNALLEAEKNRPQPAIFEEYFGMFTNNCFHYSLNILKDLGFDTESQKFLDFIVEQVMSKPEVTSFVRHGIIESRGRIGDRILSHLVTNTETLKEYLIESAYSQLGVK